MMRDTITSLGANRAPRIKDTDFTVPTLTLDDFEVEEPASTGTPWAISRDALAQRQLASVCIQMAKLCQVISRILEVAYDENPIGHTGILYPKEDSDNSEERVGAHTLGGTYKLETCEEELRQWREQVPDDALHQSPCPSVNLAHEQAPYIHRAVLSMLYFMAMFSLHRPRALADRTRGVANSEAGQRSLQLMRFAAASVNKIAMELYQVDLMRYLSATGISCILAISFSHVFDLKSPEHQVRREGLLRLEECTLALRELVDAHLAAEWAIKFLTSAASRIARLSKGRRRTVATKEMEPREDIQVFSQSGRNNAIQAESTFAQQGEISTSNLTDLRSTELPSWQPMGFMPQENDRFASNSLSLLPEDNSEFLSFPDTWNSMTAPYESLFEANYSGTFGSFP
jgi:hypothetical protein